MDEMHWLKIMGEWLINGGTDRHPATWEGLLFALEEVRYIAREELEVVLTSEIISPSFATLPS
jgi:hypothetical protein